MSESESNYGSEEQGLGINFYHHIGRGIRSSEAELEPMTSSGMRCTPEARLMARGKLPPAHPAEENAEDSFTLIDELLEDNYRGQAETFIRVSRGPSVRSLSSSCRSTAANSVLGELSPSSASAKIYTPNRRLSHGQDFVAVQRSQSLRALSSPGRVVLESSFLQRGSGNCGGFSPIVPYSPSPHSAHPSNLRTTRQRNRSYTGPRGPIYFTRQEIDAITTLVLANPPRCERHNHCTDCHNLEFAYFENRAMPTSIPPEERQKIINNNRSLRNIKNELENLAENQAITDEQYDAIMRALPAEASLNNVSLNIPRANAALSPAPSSTSTSANESPPPAYLNPAAPSLPNRQTAQPQKPEIARATALYRYAEPDDCCFEVGDEIAVFEYMNADWWLGQNLRTGKEGVFPVNYVQAQPKSQRFGGDEKAQNGNGYQSQQGPPSAPGRSNPYNSDVPPMQIADQSSGSKPGKGKEMGKKVGKKIGNAALFGAGASIGSGIVRAIF